LSPITCVEELSHDLQGLIRAATCKLAREFTFQPHPLRVTWPYGGSDDVVLLINASTQRRGTNISSSSARPRSINPQQSTRSSRQGTGKEGAAATGHRAGRNITPMLAEVMYASCRENSQGWNGGSGAMSRGCNGSQGQGSQQPDQCMKVAEGYQEIVMQRSKSGLYSADLLVCMSCASLVL
jgi:hypothetical protein